MRRIVLLACFTLCLGGVNAQIKSFSELETVSTMTFTKLSSYGTKAKWAVQEQGKMDSLQYTRYIPSALVADNVSDCIMTFYKSKDVPLNYIVYQTLNKKTWDKRVAEVKKAGYIMKGGESKGDELKSLYVKGKYNVSITKGRQKPGDPLIYMVGIRIL